MPIRTTQTDDDGQDDDVDHRPAGAREKAAGRERGQGDDAEEHELVERLDLEGFLGAVERGEHRGRTR